MNNIFKKTINKIKEPFEETANEKIYKEKNLIITDMRLCTSSKDNEHIKAYIEKESKTMYFLSKRVVECGSVLCDELQNVYQIVISNYEVNEILENGKVTTICKFVPFEHKNPFRQKINQIAKVDQTINGLNIHNEGEMHLTIEQKSTIEQNISISELMESADEEMKYRFKPIKEAKEFLSLLNDISSCVKTITELKSSLVQSVAKQASGVLKIIIEMLIKKVEKEAAEKGANAK